MNTISFKVPGKPATKGSRNHFAVKKGGQYTGKVVSVGACEREKMWSAVVSLEARNAMNDACNEKPTEDPVRIGVTYYFDRPKTHFNSKGIIKSTAPKLCSKYSDIDKLNRCLYDALTGVVWKDDKQVCMEQSVKMYGTPGAEVVVTKAC